MPTPPSPVRRTHPSPRRSLRYEHAVPWICVSIIAILGIGVLLWFGDHSNPSNEAKQQATKGDELVERRQTHAQPNRTEVVEPSESGASSDWGAVPESDRVPIVNPEPIQPLIQTYQVSDALTPEAAEETHDPDIKNVESTHETPLKSRETEGTVEQQSTTIFQEVSIARKPKFVVQGITIEQDIAYRLLSRLHLNPPQDNGTRTVQQVVLNTQLEKADALKVGYAI